MKTSLVLFCVTFMLLMSCELDTGPCDNRRTVRGNTILGPSKTSTTLSTGDVANKDCHSDMTVAYYYTDPNKAKLPDRPRVNYSFRVGNGGYFPHQETSALEYDPDTGQDIYVYRAHVNQGAKNQSWNPIDFYIEARYNGTDPVRFISEIDYAVYEETTEE